ncbi:MAG: phytoene desaturase family protein, partial [Ignavibacteria bacterium]|nr:phytoene desaturase family protein [Ignavibacteria bacterium]
MPNQVVVIGSGFGGLGLAIRLQARGYQVTILEKRGQVGGRAYQLKKNGYTFDMGPSLITAPFLLEELFSLSGQKLADVVDMIPLDPYYRIFYHDGSHIDYTGNPDTMKKEMARFNSADAGRYDDFFNAVTPIYDAVIREGLGATPFDTLKQMVRFIPRALALGGFRSVTSFVNRYFMDERHRFAFSFHPLFIGGSPFRSPSIYAMIPALEREAGVWFARGGMYSVVQALAQTFTSLGGTIRTHSPVEEIVV